MEATEDRGRADLGRQPMRLPRLALTTVLPTVLPKAAAFSARTAPLFTVMIPSQAELAA